MKSINTKFQYRLDNLPRCYQIRFVHFINFNIFPISIKLGEKYSRSKRNISQFCVRCFSQDKYWKKAHEQHTLGLSFSPGLPYASERDVSSREARIGNLSDKYPGFFSRILSARLFPQQFMQHPSEANLPRESRD